MRNGLEATVAWYARQARAVANHANCTTLSSRDMTLSADN